jgi:hypothetical protein
MFVLIQATILRWDWHYVQMDQNELPFDPHHQGGPSSAAIKIFVPMVYLALAVHLSDAEINNVSKQTEASFHLTHVT